MHPPASLASLATLALVIVTLGYLFACAIWPFGPCRRCAGTGKRRAPLGRAFRLCRRCDSTGRRIRTGRKLWNHLTRLHHDATQ